MGPGNASPVIVTPQNCLLNEIRTIHHQCNDPIVIFIFKNALTKLFWTPQVHLSRFENQPSILLLNEVLYTWCQFFYSLCSSHSAVMLLMLTAVSSESVFDHHFLERLLTQKTNQMFIVVGEHSECRR